MSFVKYSVYFLAFLLSSVYCYAAAPVVDLTDIDSRLRQLEGQLNAKNNIALLARINQLADENQELRGLIEEQAHAIEVLKKRQRSLYLDIDKRINQATSSINTQASKFENISPIQDVPLASVDTAAVDKETHTISDTKKVITSNQSEKMSYENAYRYISAKKYDVAIEAFKAYLLSYPNGEFAPNAHYWLGELYLTKRRYSDAEASFNQVIQQYPLHQKAADALVKKGFVYFEQKQWAASQSVFSEVATRFPGTSAASLAEARLLELKKRLN